MVDDHTTHDRRIDRRTTDWRTLDRRTILKATATLSAGVGGAVGTGGTAAADHGGCDNFLDAPGDFPYLREGQEYGDFPQGPGELVVFAHGWNVSSVSEAQNIAYTAEDALNANGYEHPVAAYRWPSDTDWETAKRNAEDAGQNLAKWARKYQRDYDTTIRLVGHSLGARVVTVAVEEFDSYGRVFPSVALLGGAIDDDAPSMEGRWGGNIEAAAGQYTNYFSENDEILDDWYQTYEWDEAVGESGLEPGTTPPENYTDVDETEDVLHHCDYFRRDVGCMDDVVANW